MGGSRENHPIPDEGFDGGKERKEGAKRATAMVSRSPRQGGVAPKEELGGKRGRRANKV